MARDARFWRNVTIIGLAHIAVFLGLIRWSREVKKPNPSDIVWMEGGGGDAGEVAASAKPAPNELEQTPPPTPEPPRTKEAEDQPIVAPVKSDIQLPTRTPTPIATVTPTPKPSATPKPTPKPTLSLTPKPKPKPTSTPKKPLVAKATPKPTAKPKEKDDDQADAAAKKKEIVKAALAKREAGDAEGGNNAAKPIKKATASGGSGKTGAAGTGGQDSGAGGASEFGWYGNMLHDRFYSEWVQPTTVVASGAKLSALVKLRIEKDGRVSDFTVIKPSGNVVVDESVAAVAKRVTQVDPLPAGLGGQYYEVKINFELNSEQ
jgi:TonB family protein